MAAYASLRDSFTSSSNVATYAGNPFTPAAGELLVIVAVCSGTVAVGDPTDSLGGTWTKAGSAVKNTSADTLYIFVRNQLCAAVSITITMNTTGDNATGCACTVNGISGMSRAGAAAIRQFAKQDNQAGGGTPGPAFGIACLTGSVTLAACANAANPAALTPNASWSEKYDNGYGTPTTGLEVASRDSGFTGTTVTWGGTSGTAFCSAIVELDASAAGTFMVLSQTSAPVVSPSFQSSPTHSGSAIRRMLASADGSTLGTTAHAPDAVDHTSAGNTLAAQLLGPPMALGTVFVSGDEVEMAVQALEAIATNNLFLQVAIYVMSKDGATLRATIRSLTTHAAEMNTSLRSLFLATTLSSSYTTVNAQDRVMVEILGSGTPTASGSTDGHNWSLRMGMTGTSFLPRNDNLTTSTSFNPWINFARPITFVQATIDTLVEDVWLGTPPIDGTGGKDRTGTIRHHMNNVGCYMRDEAPGAAWNYSDYGMGLIGNLHKYMLGYTGDTADIDSSPILGAHFLSMFSALQFQDAPVEINDGFRTPDISPRDMARLGFLFMTKGNWNGTQVLNKNWFTSGRFGEVGPYFGNIQVPTTMSRTAGSEGTNYLNVPAGGLTSLGGNSDQADEGPGLYGTGVWYNGLDATNGNARCWPNCPLDTFVWNGHSFLETIVGIPSMGILMAFVSSAGFGTTFPDLPALDSPLSGMLSGASDPGYAFEWPGATWTAAASDAAAGLVTASVDSFETAMLGGGGFGSSQRIFLTRNGRVVRDKGFNDDPIDWASCGKVPMILNMLTSLTPPVGSPPPYLALNPTFYPTQRI